jgi:hypothetical protein
MQGLAPRAALEAVVLTSDHFQSNPSVTRKIDRKCSASGRARPEEAAVGRIDGWEEGYIGKEHRDEGNVLQAGREFS